MRYNQTYGHDYEGYGSCPPQPPLPQCRPEAINCDCGQCAKTIQEVLLALSRLVNTSQTVGLVVPVEIQTVSGGTYFFEFGLGIEAPVVVTRTTISQDNILVSICDISRIIIETSLINNPDFEARLKEALKRITEVCSPYGCCNPSYQPNPDDCLSDCACAQGIQDAICANEEVIVGINFNGNVVVNTITALTQTTEIQVLDTATLTETTTAVVENVTLLETQVDVVESVVPTTVPVVSDVVVTGVPVLEDLLTTQATVSAPVTTADNTVVTDVTTVQSPLVIGLTETTAPIVGSVQTTIENVVSDFVNPQTISGVLSGLSNFQAVPTVTTRSAVIAPAVNNSSGLRIIMDAGSLGGGLPSQNKTFFVKVNDSTGPQVRSGGIANIVTLPEVTNVLTTTDDEDPLLSEITTLGTPVLPSVVSGIQTTQETVLTDVVPTTITGTLVDEVISDNLTTLAAAPTTTTVVSNVTGQEVTVNSVAGVSTVLSDNLFTVTTTPIVRRSTIIETTVDVVDSVTLETTSAEVISGISFEEVNVLQKGVEAINGTVAECGDGIVVVDNDNGDTTIYSTCEINAIEKL